MFFGFALLLIGVLLILSKMGIIVGDIWGWVWPILILALGISILIKKDPDKK